jgi:hypothetical protein
LLIVAAVRAPMPGGIRLSRPSSTRTPVAGAPLWQRRRALRTRPSDAALNHSYSKTRPPPACSSRRRMQVPERFFHTERRAALLAEVCANGSHSSKPPARSMRIQVRGPVCCQRVWILSTVS